MNRPSEITDLVLLAPGGKLAMYRHPLDSIPRGGRLATGAELLAANRGQPFPWGSLPEPHPHHRQWREQGLGVGGLVHDRWFVTRDGRFGGAPNVPQTLPGSLRSCMYLDGGGAADVPLAENEGYAVVVDTTADDSRMYREVQLYSARHVMADGGSIVVSPIGADGVVYVGFVGRCQICPNLEMISFPQLCRSLPHYTFQLWPEWRTWSEPRALDISTKMEAA